MLFTQQKGRTMGWNSNSHLPVAVTSSQSLSFIHVLSPQQATLTVSPWSPRGEPGGGGLSAGDMKPFPTEQKGPFPASWSSYLDRAVTIVHCLCDRVKWLVKHCYAPPCDLPFQGVMTCLVHPPLHSLAPAQYSVWQVANRCFWMKECWRDTNYLMFFIVELMGNIRITMVSWTILRKGLNFMDFKDPML